MKFRLPKTRSTFYNNHSDRFFYGASPSFPLLYAENSSIRLLIFVMAVCIRPVIVKRELPVLPMCVMPSFR